MSLTHKQTRALQRSLDALESEARQKIHESLPQKAADERYAEAAGTVNDFGDEAAALTRQDFSHALFERHLGELRRIETARRRLAEGQADRCIDCGEAIGYERLAAYPYALRCVNCQDRHEKLHGENAASRL